MNDLEPTKKPSAFRKVLGLFTALVIRTWIRVVGKKVKTEESSWLAGPVATDLEIGKDFYREYAEREGLTTLENPNGAGLLQDFDLLRSKDFDPSVVNPAIRHFYERTSEYVLDVWSETYGFAQFLLWILVSSVSKAMDQLNFPVFGLEMSRGMTSDIVELRNSDGEIEQVGWLRQVVASGRTVYVGFYSTTHPPKSSGPCVKVVFPLPKGNATVLLSPANDGDRFTLTSSGGVFGKEGFYRLVETKPGEYRVKKLKSLREHFEVYVDDLGELRCDHEVKFLGLRILRLHYRMRRKADRTR